LAKPWATSPSRNLTGIWRKSVVALFVALLLVLPLMIRAVYHQHVLITVVMNALLAMTFILTLRTGLINVSMAGFWGIGAYATALLETKADISFWLALPISTVGTLILAVLLGLVVVRFSGFGFVILTLVIASIVPVFFGTFAYFGRYVGIINIPRPDAIPLPGGGHIEFVTKLPYYYLLLCIAFVCVLVLRAFYVSTFGRAWRAIGLSSQLAQSVAINPFRYRLVAWTLGSTIAGAVGSFYAAYSQSVVPGTFGPFKSIYIQIYGILGGMGFVLMGPIVGALLLTLIPELLRFLKGNEPIFTGALIILIVIFLPQGLLGLGASLRESPTISGLFGRMFPGKAKRRQGDREGPPGGADGSLAGDLTTSSAQEET
jgi:branched-chain amino acid transport system permease protein